MQPAGLGVIPCDLDRVVLQNKFPAIIPRNSPQLRRPTYLPLPAATPRHPATAVGREPDRVLSHTKPSHFTGQQSSVSVEESSFLDQTNRHATTKRHSVLHIRVNPVDQPTSRKLVLPSRIVTDLADTWRTDHHNG